MLAAAAVPVAAWAADRGNYRGTTSRNGVVTFTVTGNVVTRMGFGTHTLRCEDGRRFRLRDTANSERVPIRAERFRFGFFEKAGGVSIAGDGRFERRRANGIVQLVALINEDGDIAAEGDLTWCQTAKLRWTARRR